MRGRDSPDDGLPDPERLAREAVAEIQGALEGLVAILDLLGASSLSRSGEVGARSAGRGSEGVWKVRLGREFHDTSPEGGRLLAQGVSPGERE